jgi:uncharacterized protein YdhG (YjbR/CyaY superfamily)
MANPKATSIDEYISRFPSGTQKAMEQVRQAIHSASPGLEEGISYAIAGFRAGKSYVIYFAAYDKHIGLYPAPVNNEEFTEAFAAYKTGKGTVQFPLDQPMPVDLIKRITKFRVEENARKILAKKK